MTFEDFRRLNIGMNEVERVPTPHGNVLVAEGYKPADKEYPWGHFRVVWAIERDGMDMGRWLEIDAMHDTAENWTADEKRKARINAAVNDALGWIAANTQTGRYH